MEDFNNQINEAQTEYENGNYSRATDLLLDLYDQSDDFKITQLLGKTLFANQQFVSAVKLVDDNFSNFIKNDPELLCKIFLKNQRYIELRIIINGLAEKEKTNWLKLVEQSEQDHLNLEPNTVANLTKEFSHLGAFAAEKQQEIINDAETLPFENYLVGARLSVTDADVNPIWRTQLLNNLMRLDADMEIKFLWIDNQMYQVNPVKLIDVEKSNAYREMIKYIDSGIGQEDPIKSNQIKMVTMVNLQLIYPFIDEIIANPVDWVKVIEMNLFGMQPENVDDFTEINQWFKRVQKIMDSLISK